jgi:hypothetical protein
VASLKLFFTENEKLVAGLAAIVAIFVSSISLFVAVRAMALQRAHNRKSTLPIAFISMGDYEEQVFVRLNSEGAGPMIIDRVSVRDIETKEEVGSSLIELMPPRITWETFVRDIRGRALRPDKDILLISLVGDPDDPQFVASRDEVRRALSRLSVRVEFHSVYEEKSATERALDWFGREKGREKRDRA